MGVLDDIRTLHANTDADFQHTMRLVRHITSACSDTTSPTEIQKE
jgi:hypothetical protein